MLIPQTTHKTQFMVAAQLRGEEGHDEFWFASREEAIKRISDMTRVNPTIVCEFFRVETFQAYCFLD